MKIPYFVFLLILPLLLSCKPQTDYPEGYQGPSIHFGQGGGFTGMVTHYVILEDGRLFQRSADSTFTFLQQWDDAFVRQAFLNYETLQLEKENYYEPGNLYYFIEYYDPPADVHRIGWGREGFRPHDNVVRFYNLLYKSTNSSP